MARSGAHRPGTFCWHDIGTTDLARLKRFYRSLFGWTAKDFPMGDGEKHYTIFRLRGKDVCSLYPAPPPRKGTKPAWKPYIAVKNADAIAKKVKAAGGTVLLAPLEVMGLGRAAIFKDPSGAEVAVWQARRHRGSQIDDVPGAVCWHDLNTRKRQAAIPFYSAVFGWKPQQIGVGRYSYHIFKLGRMNAAGMWPVAMDGLAAMWLTYFETRDCAAAVAKAKRLGATALMGATEVPGPGHRFAVLRDPLGAAFGLFEFNKR